MLCPTCERTCGDEEEICLRCRTVLREPVVMRDAPAEDSGGSSSAWVWIVLGVLAVGSVFGLFAWLGRAATSQARAAAPVDEAAAYRRAFLTSFNEGCLKKNKQKFCDCAGPKVLEEFKPDEIDAVVEATKNGRPDVRMSAIMVQCSR